jgi:hypothetical protein
MRSSVVQVWRIGIKSDYDDRDNLDSIISIVHLAHLKGVVTIDRWYEYRM